MAEQLRVRASLRLMRGGKLFGPGVAQLLQGVDELGSLRKSAAQMGMSYNKAWNVVHGCEEQLGFALLERRIGGAGGGGAALTERGRALLTRYRVFDAEAHALLDRIARRHFAGVLGDAEEGS
ncbi:MAG: LysR family transcriptional regulator [Eubacteriales bacterium]|nr:LysR family transcriptional regulator [Eubacteriales bacterium]